MEFWVWGAADSANGACSEVKECLLLYLSVTVSPRTVHAMCFMSKSYGTVFLSACSTADEAFVEARIGDNVTKYTLPCWFKGSVSKMKVSSEFIVVSAVHGHLYVLKYEREHEHDSNSGRLLPANLDGSLKSVFTHCTQPIVLEDLLLELSSSEILLKTATFDSAAVFDVMGTWLVYSPTKSEIDYFKRLQISKDSAANGRSDKKAVAKSMYTPVKLPLGNPLLVSMMSSLSNNAFDKLFKLSQFGTKKFRSYMSSSENIIDKDVSLHSISNSIGKALYSTATKLKKQALSSSSNEFVKVIDLRNGQVMATFKPPGGISHLSLSPYDLHLIQVSYRGDNFYMWDLYKLPKEVSLVEKFTRGKTSAKIKDVVWFVNDKNTETLSGTNSGFGCVTKESGSLHWFNINYLFCGNETSNYPNVINTGLAQKSPASGQFLDSWILPSNKALKFLKLPPASNMSKSNNGADTNTRSALTQLSFLDSDGSLRLLSPLNGKHTFKYVLPKAPHNFTESTESTNDSNGNSHHGPANNGIPIFPRSSETCKGRKFDVPLSQTEIETAAPYMSLIKNRKVEILRYDLGDENGDAFFQLFASFGNEIPTVQQRFAKDSGSSTPLHASGEISIDGGLELNIDDQYEGDP